MRDKDDGRPETVTPIRTMVLGYLGVIVILSIGMTCGWFLGQDRAWADQVELRRAVAETNIALAEAIEFRARIQPWLWVEGCNPDPVADLRSWDAMRRLVTLACNQDIQIPE